MLTDYPDDSVSLTGAIIVQKWKKRSAEESGKSVARIVLVGDTLEEWRNDQKEDPSISLVYRGLEVGVRPSHGDSFQ